jgi:hypothetical protein
LFVWLVRVGGHVCLWESSKCGLPSAYTLWLIQINIICTPFLNPTPLLTPNCTLRFPVLKKIMIIIMYHCLSFLISRLQTVMFLYTLLIPTPFLTPKCTLRLKKSW